MHSNNNPALPISPRSNLEVINDLDQRGELNQLIRAGLFPAKVLLHRDVFYYVDAQQKRNVNKKRAVLSAAVEFNLEPRSVYRILKSMAFILV